MRGFFLIAASAVALAGCQSAAERHAAETGEIDARNASMDEISGLTKAARAKNALQPGEWETAIRIVSTDLSGLPPAEREAQLAAVKRQERQSKRCAKAEDLKPFDIEALARVAGDCTFPRYVLKGGKLDAEIRCTQGGAVTALTLQGTISKTGYDVVTTQGAGTGHGFTLRATGNRLGDCAR